MKYTGRVLNLLSLLLRPRLAQFLSLAPDQNMTPTFYRKKLPSTTVSFSSSEGRKIFESAMSRGGTFTFFALIEQL